MITFSRLERAPLDEEIAVRGPIDSYPSYEPTIRSAMSKWADFTQTSMQTGHTWKRWWGLTVYHGLRLSGDEAEPTALPLRAHMRSLGALGLARFMQEWLAGPESVAKQLAVRPRSGRYTSFYDIDLYNTLSISRELDEDVVDFLQLDVPDPTAAEADYQHLEDIAYASARPLAGYPVESIQSGQRPLLPFHPTLRLLAVSMSREEYEPDEAWFRGGQLLVQRIKQPPDDSRDDLRQVLIVPFADTSKTY